MRSRSVPQLAIIHVAPLLATACLRLGRLRDTAQTFAAGARLRPELLVALAATVEAPDPGHIGCFRTRIMIAPPLVLARPQGGAVRPAQGAVLGDIERKALQARRIRPVAVDVIDIAGLGDIRRDEDDQV